MTKSVKLLFKDAMNDKGFDEAMLLQNPKDYQRPNNFSHETKKILYSCAYYGYLLGKGVFNEERYNI